MYLIGDELTVTGLQLAGLKAVHRANPGNVAAVLSELPADQEIILITQSLAVHAQDEIELIRRRGTMVIEIPDKSGVGGEDVMKKLIADAIGFELN